VARDRFAAETTVLAGEHASAFEAYRGQRGTSGNGLPGDGIPMIWGTTYRRIESRGVMLSISPSDIVPFPRHATRVRAAAENRSLGGARADLEADRMTLLTEVGAVSKRLESPHGNARGRRASGPDGGGSSNSDVRSPGRRCGGCLARDRPQRAGE